MKIYNLAKTLVAALVLAAGGTAVNAQTLLNGDFSSPATSGYTTVAPDDFTATVAADQTNGNIGVINSSVSYIGGLNTDSPTPQIEYQSAGTTTAQAGLATSVGLYQEVGALQANTTYTFTVGEALSSQYAGSGTFELGLYTAANATDPLALQTLQSYTDTASSAADFNQFQYQNVSFTTGSSPSGYLTVALSLAGPTTQGYFANATLTSTPEPSTWALMLLGLGGLAFGLRCRQMKG
jgi:hypothetical protein